MGDVLRKSWISIAICLVSVVPLHGQVKFDNFEDYDLAMFDRPKLTREVTQGRIEYSDGLDELWARALDRPDAELQRLVIDTLAIAHQRGVEGIDAFKPRLVEMARAPEQSRDVLRALVHALIEFDARDQDELLADLATQHGAPIGQIVEPALAEWKSRAMEKVWLERITRPPAGTAMMALAIEGLSALGSESAVEPLKVIVRNIGEQSQLRMTAARGLGELLDTGLVELAGQIAGQDSQPQSLHPILATQLLARHSDEEAIELLTSLLDRQSTVVQSEALEQLYRIDFNLVDQHREKLLTSPDVNVRRWCLLAIVDKHQVDRIEPICRLLDDINPKLRREAASSLISLANDPALRDVVIAESSNVLGKMDWRGCEQACVVLTRLDHKPSGQRMVELLGHPRGEVQVAAAWGLSKLRIQELLPDMLDHAESVYAGFVSGQLVDTMPGASLHIAHLFIAFGDQGYRPAEPLMRKYLPKNHDLGLESRPAAAWAMGLFYENDPQPDLISIFIGRLYDNQISPDTEELRDMCAVSLGRMKAESTLPDLRKFAAQGMLSCYWAIEQMTGEKPPTPTFEPTIIDDWFLAPLSQSQQ